MVAHREFSAWINCDGYVLDEYEVRVDPEGPRATCWIPSIAGKHFSVHWKDHGTSIPTASYIVMDGCTVAGRFLWGHGETFRSGARSGPNSERPFVFAKIEENAGSSASQPPSPQDVGIITLKIKRVQRGDPRMANRLQVLPGKITSEWKATTGGHCVTFDREVSYFEQYPTTWSAKPWEPGDESSYVKFVFRYRPIEFLQSQGIAPHILTPPRRAVVAPNPPLPVPGMIMWTSPNSKTLASSGSGPSTPSNKRRVSGAGSEGGSGTLSGSTTPTPVRMQGIPGGASNASPQSIRSFHSPNSGVPGISSRHSSGSHSLAARAFEDYMNFSEGADIEQEFDQDDDDMEE